MLDPNDRCLLSEQVQPPPGYEFDEALICTYSLDLTALAGVPLALLQSDPQTLTEDGAARLAAIHAVRELATRITVFCQAGAIHVPAEWRDAFLWLESTVVQVRPTAERAVFHPKLWLLRYVCEDRPVIYRMLVLSRNLTYDRSWDVIAQLEGEVASRKTAIRANAPLVKFVKALGTDSIPITGDIAQLHRERQARFANELSAVRFAFQDDDVSSWSFWPVGIPGHQLRLDQLFSGQNSPFKDWAANANLNGRRLLVISPFVSSGLLGELSTAKFPVTLVSREDALDKCAESLPDQWFAEGEGAYSFNQALAVDGEELSGLHAKLWVADDGWDAHVWMGSANATEAAFTRNIEFLMQLTGSRSKLGVEATLCEENGLGPMISEYSRPEPPDANQIKMKRQQEVLDWLHNDLITKERFRAQISPSDGTTWRLSLDLQCAGTLHVEGQPVQWKARPVSVSWARMVSLVEDGPPCCCEPLALHELTEFWTITLFVPGTDLCSEAVVRMKTKGQWPAFSERESAALSRHLRDANSLALYLDFVLARDDEGLRKRLRKQRQRGGGGRASVVAARPLFETLLSALAERPEALSEVADLVNSSRASGLFQDAAFERLWTAFLDAKEQLEASSSANAR